MFLKQFKSVVSTKCNCKKNNPKLKMCVSLWIFHSAAQTDHHHATAAGGNVIIKALRDAV